MGVSFVTYKNARPTGISLSTDTCPCCGESLWDGEHLFRVERGPSQDRLDGNAEGWYSGENAKRGFASSYSGYGRLRNALAEIGMGVPPETVWEDDSLAGEPFYRLVFFADNEGALGPETCKLLAGQFAEKSGDAIRYFRQGYQEAEASHWIADYDRLARNFHDAGEQGWVVLR
jgi:hypothetical protein